MTTKAAKKAEGWTKIDPPIPIEIEHQRSKERKTLNADARYRGKIEARWPGAGVMVFDLVTGFGASDARDWRLTIDSARLITGNQEHAFSAPSLTQTGKPKVYGRPKQQEQLGLFDAPPVVVQPAPTPPASPATFRKKAHAKLTGRT